eukprot:GEZU01032577.1.p1 GENE.GEZU01032577.1~~GEZU01032577.1.p1  ORF type:complete len:341 (-),score=139.67 GEZU01032577.1:46-1068(-)
MNNSDDLVWTLLKRRFCSFKVSVQGIPGQKFCRNRFNNTGLCNKSACPLANSKYATVIEKRGKVYLYMKTAERVHTPAKMWEKVLLSKNYAEALQQISDHLKYWPKLTIHKCKQRLTKIVQYMIRMRKLRKVEGTKLERVNRKEEKQLKRREAKAERIANLEKSIENELLERLRQGTYGDVYNYPMTNYKKMLDKNEDESSKKEREMQQEIEYVEDEDDDPFDSDLEDMGAEFEGEYEDGPELALEEDDDDEEDNDDSDGGADDSEDAGASDDDDDKEDEKPKKASGKDDKVAALAAAAAAALQKKRSTKSSGAKKPTKKRREHREIEYEGENEYDSLRH